MIFYFTGTGNSKFLAKELLEEGERIISMAEANQKGEFQYQVENGEKVGFVFPTYFYTVPFFVSDFVKKLQLTNVDYIYAVISCGGNIGQSDAVLKKVIEQKGWKLHYAESLVMPDNSMLFYQIPKQEENEKKLDQASDKIRSIKDNIAARKECKIGDHTWQSSIVSFAYKKWMKTKKFYVEDQCISCGLCERNCPENVIRLIDQKPVWEKESCCKCSGCINRCPVQAIQYGKVTKKRNRYSNPRV